MADLPGGIPRPPHVYVPGQTERHPEDWFDAIKGTVQAGMSASELEASAAFRAGLAYFDAGYFWECHEVLEAVWMETPDGSAEREMVQAIIQLANARLKLLMNRPKAARRLCDMVCAHLERVGQDAPILGIESTELAKKVAVLRGEISG